MYKKEDKTVQWVNIYSIYVRESLSKQYLEIKFPLLLMNFKSLCDRAAQSEDQLILPYLNKTEQFMNRREA